MNPTNDPTIKVLLEQDTPFLYQIWQGTPLDVSIGTVDMRRNDIGHHYSTLQVSLIQRMAAIILFHRKPQRPTHCPVIIKMSHQSPHREHSVPVQYPRCMDVPSLPVLMSKEPFMRKTLRKVKLPTVGVDCIGYSRTRTIATSSAEATHDCAHCVLLAGAAGH